MKQYYQRKYLTYQMQCNLKIALLIVEGLMFNGYQIVNNIIKQSLVHKQKHCHYIIL